MLQYVAVDNVVFDAGNAAAWNSGMHDGGTAVEDISEKIVKAPMSKGFYRRERLQE